MHITSAPQGQPHTDRQRQRADEKAQRIGRLLDDLRGQESLLEPSRRAILAIAMRLALRRLDSAMEVNP